MTTSSNLTPVQLVIVALHRANHSPQTVDAIRLAVRDHSTYRISTLLHACVRYGLATSGQQQGTRYYTATEAGDLVADLLIKYPDVYRSRTLVEIRNVVCGNGLRPVTAQDILNIRKIYAALSDKPSGVAPDDIVNETSLSECAIFRAIGMLTSRGHVKLDELPERKVYVLTEAGHLAAVRDARARQ